MPSLFAVKPAGLYVVSMKPRMFIQPRCNIQALADMAQTVHEVGIPCLIPHGRGNSTYDKPRIEVGSDDQDG
jgi:hypothetical protein